GLPFAGALCFELRLMLLNLVFEPARIAFGNADRLGDTAARRPRPNSFAADAVAFFEIRVRQVHSLLPYSYVRERSYAGRSGPSTTRTGSSRKRGEFV